MGFGPFWGVAKPFVTMGCPFDFACVSSQCTINIFIFLYVFLFRSEQPHAAFPRPRCFEPWAVVGQSEQARLPFRRCRESMRLCFPSRGTMVSATLTMMKRWGCGSLRHLLDNLESSSHVYLAGTSLVTTSSTSLGRASLLSDLSGLPTAVHSHHLLLHDLPLLAFSELKEIEKVVLWQSTEDEGRKIS